MWRVGCGELGGGEMYEIPDINSQFLYATANDIDKLQHSIIGCSENKYKGIVLFLSKIVIGFYHLRQQYFLLK